MHIAEIATVAKSLPRSLRMSHKWLVSNTFLFTYRILKENILQTFFENKYGFISQHIRFRQLTHTAASMNRIIHISLNNVSFTKILFCEDTWKKGEWQRNPQRMPAGDWKIMRIFAEVYSKALLAQWNRKRPIS